MQKSFFLSLITATVLLLTGCSKDMDFTKTLAGSTWNFSAQDKESLYEYSNPDTVIYLGESNLDLGYRLYFETETKGTMYVHCVYTEPNFYTYAKDTAYKFTYTYQFPSGEIRFPIKDNVLAMQFSLSNDNQSLQITDEKWNGNLSINSPSFDDYTYLFAIGTGIFFYINTWVW